MSAITLSWPSNLEYCNHSYIYISILSINYARPEILVSCLVYIDQLLFLNKLLVFVFSKAYYQESYNSVVNVAEWLDGSFESQKSPAVVRYPKVSKYVYRVFKPKTVKG
jgi:hypothetical protein